MTKLTLLFACVIAASSIPFKSSEEFRVNVDYQFKARPAKDNTTVKFIENEASASSDLAMLPYLTVNVTIDSLNQGETRVKVSNNKNNSVSTKKTRAGSVISIEIGFTDDAKDRVTANEFTLTFLNSAKQEVNKIVIKIDEDGNFFINDEKRGKF